MAKVHGKGTVLKLDDLSGVLQDVSSIAQSTKWNPKQDKATTTTFGARGVRREVIGLGDGDVIPVAGFFSRVAGTKCHGKGASVLADAFDLSQFFKNASVKNSIQLDDTNTFGDAFKERDVPGLLDASLDLDGFHDPAANASWARVRAHLAGGAAVISVVPEGAGSAAVVAIGNLVEMGKGQFSSLDLPMDNDKVTPLSAHADSDDGWDLGVVLHENKAETSAANYSSVDESAATAAGGVGHLHVTGFTSGTATVKIQHSTDNSVWADLITFAPVTGVGQERVELAAGTAVNRYVRAITTGTFSCAFFVAFGRRGFTYGAAGTYRHLRGLLGLAASSTFQLGPSGGAVSSERITGECRLRSIELPLNTEEVIRFNAELVVTGAPTYDTF